MHDPSFSLLRKEQRFAGSHLVNRHNVKLFIQILVGLALAHFIGQRFRPSDAAPSSTKSNWKHRPQKVQPTTLSDGKFTLTMIVFDLFISTGRVYKENRIVSIFDNYMTTTCWFNR
jgi:hypothetical protein